MPVVLRAAQRVLTGLETLERSVLRYPALNALIAGDRRIVHDARSWSEKRRPEIMQLLSREVYGRTPERTMKAEFVLNSTDHAAVGGAAIRKQISIQFPSNPAGPVLHVLLYLPSNARGASPVFVGLNFAGNHTVDADPGITLPRVWTKETSERPVANQERSKQVRTQANPIDRGRVAHRWPVEKLLAQGYGLATVYYGDIEPDFDGGIQFGVRSLFLTKGSTSFRPDEWGALGAWAWGMSRIADYLETDRQVDAKRLAIIGHSRLGKAALWAAAQDTRFSLVISNESGMGGASLYRAKTGETIEHLNGAFPHWFCANFHRYSGHPEQVPIDGNLLLSMIAPRPLYVASAEGDAYSNPSAEFLSTALASPVYGLFGKEGVGTRIPPLNSSVMNTIGYHMRTGKHEVMPFDWEQFLKFAGMNFKM